MSFGERFDQAGIITLNLSDLELLEKAGQTEVADSQTVLASSPPEGTSNECFACCVGYLSHPFEILWRMAPPGAR